MDFTNIPKIHKSRMSYKTPITYESSNFQLSSREHLGIPPVHGYMSKPILQTISLFPICYF